ncbi:MAG: molecular chaperone Hsp33 [Parasphingorhabdus sp.]|jgi:molecular chaperone Hsp33
MTTDAKSSPDELLRFLFDGLNIRGEIAQISASYQEVLSQQDYPPAIQQLLGEFLVASALLSATLKFDGNLILQLKTSGQLQLLMSECRKKSLLRGIARFDYDVSHDLLGIGQLVITIEPDRGERYQGIIEYQGTTLAQALETYFNQSEQLNTKLWLAADGKVAAGLLIQELPSNPDDHLENEDADAWNRITLLANTMGQQELTGLDKMQALQRLFHEETVRVFTPQQLKFECTCSSQRTENVLLNFGQEEVRKLLAEQGTISIDCQFCHRQFLFEKNDVENLFHNTTH